MSRQLVREHGCSCDFPYSVHEYKLQCCLIRTQWKQVYLKAHTPVETLPMFSINKSRGASLWTHKGENEPSRDYKVTVEDTWNTAHAAVCFKKKEKKRGKTMTARHTPWRNLLKSNHFLVCCHNIYMRLYNWTESQRFQWECYMMGAIWQKKKPILNTVMALSTLPELHLIILYI